MLSILCLRINRNPSFKVIDRKVIQMQARPMRHDHIYWECKETKDHIDTEVVRVDIYSESKFDNKEIHDFIVYCN